MTNHSETTGHPDNSGIPGRDGHERAGTPQPDECAGRPESTDPSANGGGKDRAPRPENPTCTAYDSHGDEQQVTLRSPAELADALPYLLGYRPEDSIVLVALHEKDGKGRFGGRARLGIPAHADDWPSAARQLVHGLVKGSERRGTRPQQMVVFLCHEPGRGETGRQVKERLGPLAHTLRLECGALDIPVVEALCISDGRFWSYCCDDQGCCPAEGTPMGLPGTSVLAAAATYAGLQVRGTLRELRARLLPWEHSAAVEQEVALDAAGMTLVPKILDAAGRHEVAEETLGLAQRIMGRFAEAPPAPGTLPADLRDDELLGHDEAATLILGLQDRTTRDRAAEWMEGDEAGPALRLWRALARRCVGPYGEHAAAPLTLAGWVAWSAGDELEAREALAMALGADPDYLFARLLHQACNEGLDPESIRRCLRTEREGRGKGTPDEPAGGSELREEGDDEPPAVEPAVPCPRAAPLPRRRRTRASGTGSDSGSPRQTRTEADRPSGRLPYPRASAGGTRPGGGAPGGARPSAGDERGTHPGGARSGTSRPGTSRPGTVGPGTGRRRGVSRGGATQAGRQTGDGEE
ncbi:DUF4192 domain-containing protein [Streptomyces griseoloalbus]|uniref:DUF4192 domain-containing protein n=1 Tax=Streptomyces griseoloalbus TaxID=67303 RepID=A0A7W8FCH8_9ACTN|nr:DUF4192 domain-containing protein [Streptomyces albaduncus]MBB5129380.1 hypothetical protein [Streptomyces albaduncus]GGW67126.1 hypothetical protein GCM10010340_51650 [Streptomyces albaduncus]